MNVKDINIKECIIEIVNFLGRRSCRLTGVFFLCCVFCVISREGIDISHTAFYHFIIYYWKEAEGTVWKTAPSLEAEDKCWCSWFS